MANKQQKHPAEEAAESFRALGKQWERVQPTLTIAEQRERQYGVDNHRFYKAWYWIQMALLLALTVVMLIWPAQTAQAVHDFLDNVRFSGIGAWW